MCVCVSLPYQGLLGGILPSDPWRTRTNLKCQCRLSNRREIQWARKKRNFEGYAIRNIYLSGPTYHIILELDLAGTNLLPRSQAQAQGSRFNRSIIAIWRWLGVGRPLLFDLRNLFP